MKAVQPKTFWILVLAFMYVPAAVTWAQTQTGGNTAPSGQKIAVLNVNQAIVSTAEGKDASAQQKRFTKSTEANLDITGPPQ
jgi:hypothetical protein